MNDEEKGSDLYSNRNRSSIGNLIALIFRLLFCRPVWTRNKGRKKCNRYVFVKFSAWHFAGSDMLWAGLVMQLCQALQDSFGNLQLSLYRVAQYNQNEDGVKKKIEDSSEDWRSKKVCCCPLWVFVLVTLIVCLFILVPISVFTFSDLKPEGGEDQEYDVLGGFTIAMLGVPAAGVMRFIFMLIKNLIFRQDAYVRNALDNKKISEQLGLMHEVRKEMRLLSCFVHFMEIFMKQKIKVVLEITNLDRCTPAKIVGVLDAINILLSDEEGPFISLLAVDPEVLTQKIDQAKDCFSKKDRAYGFLDRIITLPFTIPPLGEESKRKVFKNIVSNQSEEPFDPRSNEVDHLHSVNTTVSLEDAPLIESSLNDEARATSLRESETPSYHFNESGRENLEGLIHKAFESMCGTSRLQTYISENTVSMRRVSNSIRVSMTAMGTLNADAPPPERVAAWVVLVDRWPCKLSWIIQCMEDEQQTLQTGQAMVWDHSRTLWDVFSEHRIELHVMREEVEKFLERDDDPELFENFLKDDYIFTVAEADRLKKYTVNLDYSIKNELARIRQLSTLRAIGKYTCKNLSPNLVLNMSVEDVCKEVSKQKKEFCID